MSRVVDLVLDFVFRPRVVVAIEIQAGAAVSGPFNIDKQQLEDMVTRAIAAQAVAPSSALIH